MKKAIIALALILGFAETARAQRTLDAQRIRQTDATAADHDTPGADFRGSARIWKNIWFVAAPITVDGTVSLPPRIEFRIKWDIAGSGINESFEDRTISITKASPTAETIMNLNGASGSSSNVRVVENAGMEFLNATLAQSGSNAGRIRYNSATQSFEVSENGGAFNALAKGSIPTTATANFVFAGPVSGGAATPTFRALVANDIPTLDAAKIGTGTFTAGRVDSTSILNGTILFADWNQNACGTGNIPKWNGTAWACAGDDTSPGGSSWLTSGNTLGAGTATLGSTDAFDWSIVRGGTTIAAVGSAGITLSGGADLNGTVGSQIDMAAATTTGHSIITSGTAGISASYWTSTRSTAAALPGATEGRIYFDNGLSKWRISEAGGAYQDLIKPSVVPKTLATFKPDDAEQPATNFATLVVRNNHPVLAYDAATDETVYFTGVVPDWYDDTSGISVIVHWAAATATTGNVIWSATVEEMNATTDIDADSFGTEVTTTQTTLGTSGFVRSTTMNLTRAQADTISANSTFRVRVRRNASNVGDTMAGDAQIVAVHVRIQ